MGLLGLGRIPLLDEQIPPRMGNRSDEVDVATPLVTSGNDHIFGQHPEQLGSRGLVSRIETEGHHGQFDIVGHDRSRYAAKGQEAALVTANSYQHLTGI